MQCGVCTWMFGEMDLDWIAMSVGRLGFDGIELLADPDRYEARDVMRILSRHGLRVLSLTPGDADPAHPDSAVREKAIEAYHRMLDLAAGVGAGIMGFHGDVGRFRPVSVQEEEEDLLLDSAQRIAEYAATLGIRLVIEVLNRYESHLLNRAEQAVRFVERARSPNVAVLLDTYHMNIEESDPSAAIDTVGARLRLFHVADSNRRGIGRGNVPFNEIFERLLANGYGGPVIVESVAPTRNPFLPAQSAAEVGQTLDEAATSLEWLRESEKRWERQGAGPANGCRERQETYNSGEQQRLLHKEEA